jgi:glycosyltransferase involved in cell wall biosynthesis
MARHGYVALQNWRSAVQYANRLSMLSVLIETRNDEEALSRTLASLIGAAVEGAVREVIVCDRGSTDQTRYVAEHAGCQFIAGGGIATGIARAKGDWLLILEPGARLVEGWIEPVAMHIAKSAMPARFSRARSERLPFLARVFSANRALAQGLVLSKQQAFPLARNAGSAEALARGLAVKTLSAEIAPASPKKA